MIPSAFEYHKAHSVDDALGMLEKHGFDAKLLAGGQSLLPAMKLRLNAPGVLIDISRIKELDYLKPYDGGVAIGAATTHHGISRSKELKKSWPIMHEAAELIGDVQVRNMGTLGGSIAHADPAADWPAVLLALDASIELKGPNGHRSVPATEFFTGFYMTALEENEIIVEVRLPAPPKGTGMSYQKFMQPASRFAIVGCAAVINHEEQYYRIAFTGVSDGPFLDEGVAKALEGKDLNADTIAAAAEKAAAEVDAMADHFATEEYRKHLARVFAKRAISAAAGV